MRIVVTTPTGNIGSAVTRALLDAGEQPLLISRDLARAKESTDRSAIARQGSHSDAALLTESSVGAPALFLVSPLDLQVQDLRAHYRTFAEAAVTAINANSIPHVVHLSSIGADLERGNGPVAGLHIAEQLLNAAEIPNLSHLRPSYFMDNTLGQLPNILQAGSLFTTFPEGTRFPMIATRDIGLRVAELLRSRNWTGTRVVELLGAADISYEDVSRILTEVLGREVRHVTVPEEQLVQALTNMGFSTVLAKSFTELTDALAKGLMKPHESRSETSTTPTTFAEFAEQVFLPLLQQAMAA